MRRIHPRARADARLRWAARRAREHSLSSRRRGAPSSSRAALVFCVSRPPSSTCAATCSRACRCACPPRSSGSRMQRHDGDRRRRVARRARRPRGSARPRGSRRGGAAAAALVEARCSRARGRRGPLEVWTRAPPRARGFAAVLAALRGSRAGRAVCAGSPASRRSRRARSRRARVAWRRAGARCVVMARRGRRGSGAARHRGEPADDKEAGLVLLPRRSRSATRP